MRNVTLILSIDWVPPFKESQDESIGILAATVANWKNDFRASADMIMPLAIIAGPNEPSHCCTILRNTMTQLKHLAEEGLP
jgi:hypothetical protein